ncbi:hypothetical protein JK628_13055 [Shewanella sp. KX20019]|uniref:hypothetical protein n=1 Tax=Shewanella sp. KX20019 TaxID=2803864 RepID=UPI0019279A9B|nr:hypothetical protein [Shewanella sp. KX20019]QQX78511.1 hypothetical protein JK628_13055 [Shewanella sp. KX20019]
MKYSILFLVCFTTLPAMAGVYRCAGDVYQSDPCDDSSQPVDLSNVGSVVANDNALYTSDATLRSAASTDKKAEISTYIRNRQIDREISKLKTRRKKVLVNRDQRMVNLRNRGRYANNNLAGATWQQSLAQEMSAITQQADTEVSTIDRQITRLRSEIK